MSNLFPWATPARHCARFPKAVRASSNIAAFRSMRSRTCFRAPRPTAKLLESSFPSQSAVKGRPLTPLHGGHVAVCAVRAMLNGVFGSGKNLHVAAWQAFKFIDRSDRASATCG